MRDTPILVPKRFGSLFPVNWPSLRSWMTISYVAVTLGSVLSFILLGALARSALSTLGAFTPPGEFSSALQRQAQSYALLASLQGRGAALDPRTNFIPGQAGTIALAYQDSKNPGLSLSVFAPYITSNATDASSVALALLIAPDGHVATSSYLAHYPAGMADTALRSAQARAIGQALAGEAMTGTEQLPSATLEYAAEPVWGTAHQPIGAIFLQAPRPQEVGFLPSLWNSLSGSIILLVLMTPVGVLFGWITTRGLVGRLQRLVLATTRFAGGEYSQRIPSNHHDEIGQLERQFNQMAEQLVDTIGRQQQLAEQNARLEERSRISRELHDAVSQDLFSLRMMADGLQQATLAEAPSSNLRSHVALLEETTASVIREMRALLLELRPTELENLSLADALRKLAHVYSTRLNIDVTAQVAPVRLDAAAEHALLRIAQEALANAARHSGATMISLALVSEGNSVTLTITDNGGGFARDEGMEGIGLGLRIMEERVKELHGAFDLTSAPTSAPGHGTRISATLPQEHTHD